MAKKKTPVAKAEQKESKARKPSAGRKPRGKKAAKAAEPGGNNAGKSEFPSDTVEKMTAQEAMSFRALDAELRNTLQGIKLIDLEVEKLEREFRDKVKGIEAAYREKILEKQAEREQLRVAFDSKQADYNEVVQGIAEARGLDPTQMALDPEARTIRDLRGGEELPAQRN
jgi:hypothetical protein